MSFEELVELLKKKKRARDPEKMAAAIEKLMKEGKTEQAEAMLK
jgi:hypothetical protein